MSDAIVIASGGMDSATALFWSRRYQTESPLVLSFDYGQRHVKELSFAAEMCEHLGLEHQVVDLTGLQPLIATSVLTDHTTEVPEGHYAQENMKQTVVPNRNMIMLSIATGVAVARNSHSVIVGVHAGDHPVYPDCREGFIIDFELAAHTANEGFLKENFRVIAPFVLMSKAEIVELGDDLGVPWELTWSCYKGGQHHCGRCATCVERLEAFDIAEIDDPTLYEDKEYWRTVVNS